LLSGRAAGGRGLGEAFSTAPKTQLEYRVQAFPLFDIALSDP
jgi:hypothetical protein